MNKKILSHDVLSLLFLSVLASDEKEMVAVEGERMLRLAEQCLERAKSFIGKSADPPEVSTSASAPASSCLSPVQSQLHQTAVPTGTVIKNTGKYFLSSEKL